MRDGREGKRERGGEEEEEKMKTKKKETVFIKHSRDIAIAKKRHISSCTVTETSLISR